MKLFSRSGWNVCWSSSGCVWCTAEGRRRSWRWARFTHHSLSRLCPDWLAGAAGQEERMRRQREEQPGMTPYSCCYITFVQVKIWLARRVSIGSFTGWLAGCSPQHSTGSLKLKINLLKTGGRVKMSHYPLQGSEISKRLQQLLKAGGASIYAANRM